MESSTVKTEETKKTVIGIGLVLLLIASIIVSVIMLNSNKEVKVLSNKDAYALFAESSELTDSYKGLIEAKGGTAGFEILFEYDQVNNISHTKVSVNEDSFTETYDDTVTSYSSFDSGEHWYASDSDESTLLGDVLAPNQDSTIEESYTYEGVVDCMSFKGQCHKFTNTVENLAGGPSVLIDNSSKLVDSFILGGEQDVLFTYYDNKELSIPADIIENAGLEDFPEIIVNEEPADEEE